MMPGSWPWWHVKLRDRGCRITIPRKAIIVLLINRSWKHPTAEDIYLAVHTTYPAIGLTTVYRTLELLEEMGIIRKLVFGDGQSRYEISDGPRWRYHEHLFCIKCARVMDYMDFVTEEEKLLKKIGKALSKKYKFKIKTHQLHFYGLCEKCR
ncbi:MAG: Fur family transcriptional regulator [bacterium]